MNVDLCDCGFLNVRVVIGFGVEQLAAGTDAFSHSIVVDALSAMSATPHSAGIVCNRQIGGSIEQSKVVPVIMAAPGRPIPGIRCIVLLLPLKFSCASLPFSCVIFIAHCRFRFASGRRASFCFSFSQRSRNEWADWSRRASRINAG